ncbi:MFS transporter [Caballeronia sp. LjRoot31]|uniref:MFS transporter n=1 Tax=Caballeronia sp. LjRoot31 TaxID=3342324 RepID=UPI003ECE9644
MNPALSHVASRRDKLLILFTVCLAAVLLPLALSGGAVATPAIGRDLGGSPASLTWVTNAYMLSFGSLLMAAGALADQFGRKRLFVIGLGGFIVSSFAISLAPSVFWLDILRAIQGIVSAASLAAGSAALAQEFDGHARTRAFSMLGTSFGIGLAFGPLMAGTLIEYFGWRSLFITTGAIAAVAFMFGVPRMRESRDPNAAGLDYPGTITFSATLVLFTTAIIQAPESGWGSPLIVGLLAASVVTLVAFIMVETRARRPMLDLSLFKYVRFIGVQILPLGTCYSYILLVVMLPLRLIGAEGMSEMDSGLLMIALSAPMLVVPIAVASLTRWASPGVLSGLGFLIAAAGLYWLSLVDFSASKTALLMPMLIIGIGTGMPWGLMDGLSVSVVPNDRAGMASGIFGTTRVAGEGTGLAIGTAILAALANTSLAHRVPEGGPELSARVAEAAQRLTNGDIAAAAAALPEVSRHALSLSYADAFVGLLHVLIVITLLSAFATFAFLSRTRTQGDGFERDEKGVEAATSA